MQVDAPAEEVAGGGGLDDGDLGVDRQDRSAGQEAEEANEHRGVNQRSFRATLQQESQAVCSRDHQPGGQPAAGEGGCSSVVLQSETKGEADDAAQHGRVSSGRGGSGRRTSGTRLRPPPSPRSSHAPGPGCDLTPGPVLARVAPRTPAATAQPTDDVATPHARHAEPLTLT